MPKDRRRERGFSLVELLLVIAIIGILASVVGVNVIKQGYNARVKACQAQFVNFKTAINAYKLNTGKFPNDLKDLIDQPSDVKGWTGPYLDSDEVPKDPWGNDYAFIRGSGTGGFEIKSYGADGAEGGDQDDKDISSKDLGKGEK